MNAGREGLAEVFCPPWHREGTAGQVNGQPVTWSKPVPCIGHRVQADAALAHIAAVLRDEATVEAIEERPGCEHEDQAYRDHGYAYHCIPCDLATLAERLGITDEDHP